MAFSRGLRISTLAAKLHRWARVVERRVWDHRSPLMHFCQPASTKSKANSERNDSTALKVHTVTKLDHIRADEVMHMSVREIESIVRVPVEARLVHSYLRK